MSWLYHIGDSLPSHWLPEQDPRRFARIDIHKDQLVGRVSSDYKHIFLVPVLAESRRRIMEGID